MNEAEISELRKEIGRLNQIISVLLEHNAILKHENSYVKTLMAQSNVSNSNDKTMIGEYNVSNSNDKTVIGKNSATNVYDKTLIGNNNFVNASDKTVIGNTNITDAYHKSDIGISNSPKPLPETIHLEGWVSGTMMRHLKDVGLAKAKRKGKLNIVKLLVHFHNKGRGDYAELRKVTGISEGGMAKIIMSLKKRGLIHRTGYQQFALSTRAVQLLQKALQ